MNDAPLPILTTLRLTLRPATEADVDGIHALLADADVRRYLCDDQVFPQAVVAEMFVAASELAPRGLGWWVIEKDGAAIGMIALQPVSDAALAHVPHLKGEIEPTIALWPAHWQQGLAGEALDEAIRYAFEDLGIDHMAAMTDAPNRASQAMLTRAGFVKTGESTGPAWPTWVYRLHRNP
jgi:RimJ/RimL family protein N-acetyltransferase